MDIKLDPASYPRVNGTGYGRFESILQANNWHWTGLSYLDLTIKEISERLNISVPTVNTYIRRMYEKLHVRSRAQAVARYAHLSDSEQRPPAGTRARQPG